MGSLNLFPPVNKNAQKRSESAWKAVGRSFEAVGRNMWKAIADVEREYNITIQQPAGSR
jgi:hypothetical protein